MKKIKIFAAIFCISLTSIIGVANTSVLFATSGAPLNDHNGVDLAAQRLFLVYWSADESTSGFNNMNPLAPTGDTLLTTGGNIGFDTSAGPNIAGEITGNNPVNFTGAYEGGFLYIAIFEMAYTASPASIAPGTYYGLGPLSGALPAVPPGTSYQYGAQINANPITTNLQVVPEPSTVGLLLVGIGLVAARRFRRG